MQFARLRRTPCAGRAGKCTKDKHAPDAVRAKVENPCGHRKSRRKSGAQIVAGRILHLRAPARIRFKGDPNLPDRRLDGFGVALGNRARLGVFPLRLATLALSALIPSISHSTFTLPPPLPPNSFWPLVTCSSTLISSMLRSTSNLPPLLLVSFAPCELLLACSQLCRGSGWSHSYPMPPLALPLSFF